MEKFDIKSPIFTPKPGWGGKIKRWLAGNFNSKILPVVAIITLAIGVYLVFLS